MPKLIRHTFTEVERNAIKAALTHFNESKGLTPTDKYLLSNLLLKLQHVQRMGVTYIEV